MKSWIAALAVAAVGFGAGGYFFGAQNSSGDGSIAAHAETAPTLLAANEAGPLSEEQKAAIRELIRDQLMENPEIIRDAMEELQRKEEAAEAAAAVDTIATEKRLFTSSRQVVLGNPDGDVTLVEFFDYNCGYCKRAHADMKRLIDEDKNLRVVLKEFPVLGQGSAEAAHVGAAINLTAPEKYFEFHDALLTERGQVDGARALAVAADIGLDSEKLQEVAQSEEVQATIAEVYDLAGKLAINGTPSYVTSQELVIGAVGYDTLKIKIDEARKACAATPC